MEEHEETIFFYSKFSVLPDGRHHVQIHLRTVQSTGEAFYGFDVAAFCLQSHGTTCRCRQQQWLSFNQIIFSHKIYSRSLF